MWDTGMKMDGTAVENQNDNTEEEDSWQRVK